MANQNNIPADNERSSNESTPDWVKWFREHSIPIAGVIAVLLVVCLLQPASKIDWTKAKDFTDALRNVTQAMAFIAGGIWAYFKFVKGRTFQERLIPIVSGKFASLDGSLFLIITTRIQNVGLSRIEFNPTGSALIIFEYTPATIEKIHEVADKRLTTLDVFDEKGRYVEPNEIIERQTLIAIPTSVQPAYRLELEVLSLSGFIWQASTIVDKSTLRDNAGVEQLLDV